LASNSITRSIRLINTNVSKHNLSIVGPKQTWAFIALLETNPSQKRTRRVFARSGSQPRLESVSTARLGSPELSVQFTFKKVIGPKNMSGKDLLLSTADSMAKTMTRVLSVLSGTPRVLVMNMANMPCTIFLPVRLPYLEILFFRVLDVVFLPRGISGDLGFHIVKVQAPVLRRLHIAAYRRNSIEINHFCLGMDGQIRKLEQLQLTVDHGGLANTTRKKFCGSLIVFPRKFVQIATRRSSLRSFYCCCMDDLPDCSEKKLVDNIRDEGRRAVQ
jgi:hypothetical protein